jgi:hypothetical protein
VIRLAPDSMHTYTTFRPTMDHIRPPWKNHGSTSKRLPSVSGPTGPGHFRQPSKTTLLAPTFARNKGAAVFQALLASYNPCVPVGQIGLARLCMSHVGGLPHSSRPSPASPPSKSQTVTSERPCTAGQGESILPPGAPNATSFCGSSCHTTLTLITTIP